MRRAHRTAHARLWLILGLLLPAALLALLSLRQPTPFERPGVLLAPPPPAGETAAPDQTQ